MKQSKIHFHESWPKLELNNYTIAIVDRVLLKAPAFKKWTKQFYAVYPVTAGEGLKDFSKFQGHLTKIHKLIGELPKNEVSIVAVGGGSVGDFAGFVASIYKRGVKLEQIPSTWLSAMDSAHGGKTALNISGSKNQIGTFYPAQNIYLIKPLLMAQPKERTKEAVGELLKTALYFGKTIWSQTVIKNKFVPLDLWDLLPAVIEAKMQIVRRDPYEQEGMRFVLNLGHTMGHVFENLGKLSHGEAVGYGLVFAVLYSKRRGTLSEYEFEQIIEHPMWSLYLPEKKYDRLLALPMAKIKNALLKDKKSQEAGKVSFIFVSGIGKTKIQSVKVDEILREVKLQKLILKEHGA